MKAQSGEITDFSHFVSFVVKLSEEANSLYGWRVSGTLFRMLLDAHSSNTSQSDNRRKSALPSYNVNVSYTQNSQQSVSLVRALSTDFLNAPSLRPLPLPNIPALT